MTKFSPNKLVWLLERQKIQWVFLSFTIDIPATVSNQQDPFADR